MSHTPGPWEVVELSIGRIGVCEADTDLAICKVSQPREIAAPNARLIAAAPVLLEACEAILNRLDYLRNVWGDEGVTRSLCDQVRAAVAAAKGES